MKCMPDGCIIPNGEQTPVVYGNKKPFDEQYGIMRCRIVKTLYIDDPSNTSNGSQYPQVEYNCIVLDGKNQGQIIYNCIDGTSHGGKDNTAEVIRTADSAFQPTQQASTDYRDGDGDFVLVVNIGGKICNPIIICGYKHPQATSNGTSSNGVTSTVTYGKVTTSIGNNSFKVTNVPDKNLLQKVVQAAIAPIKSGVQSAVNAVATVASVTTQVAALKSTVDGISAKYLANPDIDVSDDINKISSIKDKADSLVSNLEGAAADKIQGAYDSITNMTNGLQGFLDSPMDVGNLKSVSGAVGQVASLIGLSKPTAFTLTPDGVTSMGNNLEKMSVDGTGQASITSVAGMGQHFALGGMMATFAPFTTINAFSAFNVNSLITKIGAIPRPTSRVGDMVINSDGSTGTIISGSNTTMG